MATKDSTDSDLESMNVEELGVWLAEQGIPEKFCKAFEGKPP